jgi:hypothetical protein
MTTLWIVFLLLLAAASIAERRASAYIDPTKVDPIVRKINQWIGKESGPTTENVTDAGRRMVRVFHILGIACIAVLFLIVLLSARHSPGPGELRWGR